MYLKFVTINLALFTMIVLNFECQSEVIYTEEIQANEALNEAQNTDFPVIVLNGQASSILEYTTGYNELGAVVLDTEDGDLSSSVVITSNFNQSVIGTYTFYYNITDSDGLDALTVERVVEIVDTTIPVITVTGGDTTISQGAIYSDLGYTANDDYDGDISINIVSSGSVDSNTEGTYTLTYDVVDSSSNSATTKYRNVTVKYCSPTRIANVPFANSGAPDNGDGGATPYTICSLSQLAEIQGDLHSYLASNFELKIDIDASSTSSWDGGSGWESLGTSASPYTGEFNGNDKTISGLIVNRLGTDDSGFVGYISSPGIIRNLRLTNTTVFGGNAIGSVVGWSAGGVLSNLISTGATVSGASSFAGILVGRMVGGSLKNGVTEGRVYGTISIGGVVGLIQAGVVIEDISSSGYVQASTSQAGGILGSMSSITKILRANSDATVASLSNFAGGIVPILNDGALLDDSHFSGKVSGGQYVGGIAGYLTSNSTKIYRSSVSGNISGTTTKIGGITGQLFGGTIISDSFFTGNLSGNSSIGGIAGISVDGIITNSYSVGTITAIGTMIGGIVGYSSSTTLIKNNFSTMTIQSCSSSCGGLIGNEAGSGTIEYNFQLNTYDGTYLFANSIETISDATDVFSKSHQVYTSTSGTWDFDDTSIDGTFQIWTENASTYPSLN